MTASSRGSPARHQPGQARPSRELTMTTEAISRDDLELQTRDGVTSEGHACFITMHYARGASDGAMPLLVTGAYSSADGGGTFGLERLPDGRYRDQDSGDVADSADDLLPGVVADGHW